MKKIIRVALAILLSLGIFIGGFLFILFFTDLFTVHYNTETYPPIIHLPSKRFPEDATTPPETLKVMTYNIKFGGGRIDFFWDCYGDRAVMTAEETYGNLSRLAMKIRQYDPDILFLQEVDRFSKRSAYIDQVKWLMENLNYPYGVYASQWNVAYIPVRNMGPINSGNAILSKYPIVWAMRKPLPLLSSQDPLTQQFYLRRNLLITKILLSPTDTLYAINTHLSAYAKDSTRYFQLQIALNLLDSLHKMGKKFVFGGDLNTIPPGSKKCKDFDDSACKGKDPDFVMDDYCRERTWLQPFYDRFQEVIPLPDYWANESQYYSSTVNGQGFWNKRLDYLFTNLSWKDGLVHQDSLHGGMETMPLSDHAPVTGTLILK
jgi:endonuclease/exonuclease/phosphatase family metal-dependent hydrolase